MAKSPMTAISNMPTLPVVMLTGGITLLYAAVKNKNPLGLIQAVLTGKPIDDVPAIDTGASGDNKDVGPGTIPLDDVPKSNVPGGDLPDDGIPNTSQGVIPRLPGEVTPMPGGVHAPVSRYTPNTPILGQRWT